jgi:hypothetical protein
MFTYDSVKYHVKKSHKITLKHYKVSVIAKCAKLPNCRYASESACSLCSGSKIRTDSFAEPSGWVEIWSVLQSASDHPVQRRPDPVVGN